MSTFAAIDAIMHDLVVKLNLAKRAPPKERRRVINVLLRLLDQLDTELDTLVSMLIPEKITDERFRLVVKQLESLTKDLAELRKLVTNGRFTKAKDKAADVHEKIRHVYRLLLIIRAPAPVLAQYAPEIELRVPPLLQFVSPIATKIYNVLARRGEMTLDELVAELGISEKQQDEFSRALQMLAQLGYVQMRVTPDNRLVLRLRVPGMK